MIIKHIKIIYNFFLDKKFSTCIFLLILFISYNINNLIIYFTNYEIIHYIKHEKFTIISNLIFALILGKSLLFTSEKLSKNYIFYKTFDTSLLKFFLSLPKNKDIFGTERKIDNILKIEWEINILSNETNKACNTMVSNFIGSISSLIFIITTLLYNFNGKYIFIIILSILIILSSIVYQKIQIYNEKKTLDIVDRNFLSINESSINFIENSSIKTTTDEYISMINTHLKKLKTIFLKIFYNKTLLSFIFMSLGMMYLFFSISLTIQCYKNLNIDLNICLSFLIYNTLFSFYTIKLIKDLSDRNIFNIIIQYNNSLISKNQHNLQTQNNVLKIETLSLKNTSLKNHNNEIENISFSINRKNHLAILSNDVCISLIREFFENYNIKKSGTILINDSEIEHINPDILKQSIITISTNITIKNNETLKYNLLLDNTNISDDILIKASKLSYLYDYIISNQFGYYAIINEESNFSELEKFQISLTRALLSDGHIIIVDFTGIDEENITIKNIKEMLITSLIDRILIIITKDTYKLEEMDKILFYNKNNFQTYIGNHKDLIKKSNEYNNFYLQNYKDIKFTE